MHRYIRLLSLLLALSSTALTQTSRRRPTNFRKLQSDLEKKLSGLLDRNQPAADRAQLFCERSKQSDGAVFNDAASTSTPCKAEYIDLMFVVDGSGSVGKDNFVRVKEFIKQVVDTVDVGASKTHVGFVQFSTNVKTEFSLNSKLSNAAVKAAVDKVKYNEGSTYVGKALRHTLENELVTAKGFRSDKKTVVIVLTDGESADDPRQYAVDMRDRGYVTIAIGIEPARISNKGLSSLFSIFKRQAQLDERQLETIAGNPDRVFIVCDFERLDQKLKDSLTSTICIEVDEKCKKSYSDLLFVVDGSGSIGSEGFANTKAFLKRIVDAQEIGPKKSRVGLVIFSDEVQTEFSLDRYDDKDRILSAIERMRWLRGTTKIGQALEHASKRELRTLRKGVDTLVFVMTDGVSEDDVKGPAEELRKKGATTFALGVGPSGDVDVRQLEAIAGGKERMVAVEEFEDLDRAQKNAILSLICNEKPSNKKPVPVSLKEKYTAGLKYVGCFEDGWTRILPKAAKPDNWNNSPVSCMARCKKLNYNIAGVQAHIYCFCGNEAHLEKMKNKKRPENQCLSHCGSTGELRRSGVMCGGTFRNSVYRLDEPDPEPFTVLPGADDSCLDVPLDLVYVVDGSSSIKQENFTKIQGFLKGITAGANIGADATQVAMVQFNEEPFTEFNFNEGTNKNAALKAIEKVEWREGETDLELALDHVADEIMDRRNGKRANTQTVVLVLTDGKSLGDPLKAAKKLRQAGAELVTIGIGKKMDKRQLLSVAGHRNRYFAVSTFDDLIAGHISKRFSDSVEVCVGPLGPLAAGLEGDGGSRPGTGSDSDGGCPKHVVIGFDRGMATSNFNTAVRRMQNLVDSLKRGSNNAKVALFNFDRRRKVGMLHDFNESQRASVIESKIKDAKRNRGRSLWSRFKMTLSRKARDGEKATVIYVGGPTSTRSRFSRDISRMQDDGDVAFLPLHFYPRRPPKAIAALERMGELMEDPSVNEILSRLDCK